MSGANTRRGGIVCVDLSPGRLELASRHGATETMVGGADVVEWIVESTAGFGADYTFEATGDIAVMRQALETARMGWGLCTVAGVVNAQIASEFAVSQQYVAVAVHYDAQTLSALDAHFYR